MPRDELIKQQDEPVKVPLILFSGGLDSTFLLQEYLQMGDVYTLYVEGAGIGVEKATKEKEAREKIIKALEKRTGNRVRMDHIVNVGDVGALDVHPNNTWKFRQAQLWLIGALNVIHHDIHSELLIGYVAGDQILADLGWIDQAWNGLQGVSRTGFVPVNFPLKYKPKNAFMSEIHPEVYKEIWTCEQPDVVDGQIIACGARRCIPCSTIAGQNHIFKLRTGKSIVAVQKEALKNYRIFRKHNDASKLAVLKQQVTDLEKEMKE